MTDQGAVLRDIILDLVPADGSNIGNQALLALLQDRIPTITEEAYQAARDVLVEEGILGKGRGRGGSVHLAVDDEDQDEDGFALEEVEEGQTPRTSSRPRRRAAAGPAQVLSYRHDEKRLNNPEVGLVHPENDPDAGKTRWAYDPHIDPALQFDVGRAQIETLIDDALGSGDADTMRDALAELKRLQAPWRHLDPELFDLLVDIVAGERNVRALQRCFGDNAVFASEPIPTTGPSAPHRSAARFAWFEKALETVRSCDLVFADPDNGLVTDEPFRRRNVRFAKQTPLSEAIALSAGRTAVIYHHNSRFKGGHDVEVNNWLRSLGSPAIAVRATAYSCRTFFIINPDDDLIERASEFCQRWKNHKVRLHPTVDSN